MKKYALRASFAALSLMGLNAAHASDGTINFTGEVVTSTCKVDANDANQTVALPNAATNQLGTVGAVASRVGFKLLVSGCAVATTGGSGGNTTTPAPAPVKLVAVAFEPGPNVNPVTGRLKPAPGTATAPAASGIEIALLNDKQEHIFIGASAATSKSQFATIDTTSGSVTLNFSAEFVASEATVKPGKMDSSVTYSLIYQ